MAMVNRLAVVHVVNNIHTENYAKISRWVESEEVLVVRVHCPRRELPSQPCFSDLG